jgi:hypothetical protein
MVTPVKYCSRSDLNAFVLESTESFIVNVPIETFGSVQSDEPLTNKTFNLISHPFWSELLLLRI